MPSRSPNHNQPAPKDLERVRAIEVDSMAFGGKGVGRKDGKVFFIENALEGDVVDVEILSDSGRYADCRVVSLIRPSAHRGPSPCRVSEQCGGCQWQGVSYPQQLEWKRQFIANALRRIGHITEPIAIEMHGAPTDLNYRNRILLRARLDPNGKLQVGYFRRGSRDFVAITRCEIAVERLNLFVEQLLARSLFEIFPAIKLAHQIKFRFELQELPLKTDHEPHLLVTVYDPDDGTFRVEHLVALFKSIPSVAWAGHIGEVANCSYIPFENHLGITYHTAAGLFQQVNITHNQLVRQIVADLVAERQPARILDLFCGSGNLSLPLASPRLSRDVQIDGVEFSKRAIATAKFNVEANQLQNSNYFAGDAEKFLWRAAKQGLSYDLVIADPPREGMFQCIIPLGKIAPKTIIYMSCDPSTLARDLGSLIKMSYKITSFRAFDFFPNTYHIESLVVLER